MKSLKMNMSTNIFDMEHKIGKAITVLLLSINTFHNFIFLHSPL